MAIGVAEQFPVPAAANRRRPRRQLDHRRGRQRAASGRAPPSLHVSRSGMTATPVTRPSPSVNATAAHVEHRVAQRRRARTHGDDEPPRSSTRAERGEHRRVLEHAAQVHRRVAGEIHRPAPRRPRRPPPLVVGIVALHHHQRLDLDAESFSPRHRRGDERAGCSKASAVGSITTRSAADIGEQPPIELVVVANGPPPQNARTPDPLIDGTRSRPQFRCCSLDARLARQVTDG